LPTDGDAVYAIVQTNDTLTGGEVKYDAHHKYLDLQYVAAGEEVIGWAHIDRLNGATPYDEKGDYVLGKVADADQTPTRLSAGQLAVLYPADAHAPRRAAGAPSSVKKIVVKVAVGK